MEGRTPSIAIFQQQPLLLLLLVVVVIGVSGYE
jgi:hypothetical protein